MLMTLSCSASLMMVNDNDEHKETTSWDGLINDRRQVESN